MLLDASKYYADSTEKNKKPKTVRRKRESEFYIPSIPGPWITKVFKLSSVAIKVALVLWRTYRMQGGQNPLEFTNKYLKPFGLSRYQKYRGVTALEKAGLVEKTQKPGHAQEITLVDFEIKKPPGKGD